MLIYIVIALVGLLLLLVMLLVGEVFGGDHEVGGHEIGHDADGGGPSIFSIRIMSAFLTAFGVGGVVARYYEFSHPAASGLGLLAGVAMAAIVYQFAKLLYSQQASSELRMHGLIGSHAEVSVAIPAGGVGQVVVTSGGARSEHIARSADGRAFARGTTVAITSLGGDSVTVGPVDAPPAGGGHVRV